MSSITLLQSNICRMPFSISCQARERLASSTEQLKLARTCSRRSQQLLKGRQDGAFCAEPALLLHPKRLRFTHA